MSTDRFFYSGNASLPSSVRTRNFAAALNKTGKNTATTATPSSPHLFGPKGPKDKENHIAIDPSQHAFRLSAHTSYLYPKPKVRRLEDFPFSTNILTHPIISGNLPASPSIINLPLSTRQTLATGPTLTIVVNMQRIPVFTSMPATAIALVSSVANQQVYGAAGFPKRVWFTDCDGDAVVALCWLVRDMFTREWKGVSGVPRIKEGGLLGLMQCYQAGRVMGMGQYLESLKNAVIVEIAAVERGLHNVHGKPILSVGGKRGAGDVVGASSEDIGYIAILTLTEKLDASDAVFQLIVGVAAKMRREGVLRELMYGKRLSVSFPKVVSGMDWLDEVEGFTRMDQEGQADIEMWLEGV